MWLSQQIINWKDHFWFLQKTVKFIKDSLINDFPWIPKTIFQSQYHNLHAFSIKLNSMINKDVEIYIIYSNNNNNGSMHQHQTLKIY